MRIFLLILMLLMGACAGNDGGNSGSEGEADVTGDDVVLPGDTTDAEDPRDAPGDTGDVHTDRDTRDLPDVATPDDARPDPDTTSDSGGLTIGEDACCLSTDGNRAVWAEGGIIWSVQLPDGAPESLAPSTGIQTDPTLSGDTVIWADDRDGTSRLHSWNFSSGEESVLLEALDGEMRAPHLDGDDLVWVAQADPEDPRTADIWHWELGSDPTSAKALIADDAEQDHPFVKDGLVVWSDYYADPQGFYTVEADPNANNADIRGYDLALKATFLVTDDPSKQLRPAIEDGVVVWLDWRGIQPQPKYAEFALYTRDMKTMGPEIKVAVSSWAQPELWERPFIHDGHVAWIAEDPTASTGVTELFMSAVSATAAGTPMRLHAGAPRGIDFRDGVIGWVGAKELHVLTKESALTQATTLEEDGTD